ncbi:hypothetical protein PF005_g29944 [Phytophthora fragariae]|uniref:RxLR effector protein n=1 Tax=Phytophthora fragariae TaxID=53985 RepID=A0A6A3VC76_9STRA|nr:hypothetical protein PF003_g32535 [Phytophthora fragariae]KAE8919956.1 hypothetical protein PF009_g29744 [Phytophthora fragariae]KAE9064551.1 hypothetical protein PF007_g29159 [Phytophthora fragariae]KAE9072040.1 hypothetical protein PF006_g29017 [Phytophthora fragariae]KAE9118461.1 hypothetical protein PF010_g8211 [Phytophthora fragariae]
MLCIYCIVAVQTWRFACGAGATGGAAAAAALCTVREQHPEPRARRTRVRRTVPIECTTGRDGGRP